MFTSVLLRRASALAGLAVAAAGVVVASPPSHASVIPPPTVVAGIANVSAPIPVGNLVFLGAADSYNSTGGSTIVNHIATGQYLVQWSNIAVDPGVLHVQGAGSGTCQIRPTGPTVAEVDCFDAVGSPADRNFWASFTRGGTEAGRLVTATNDHPSVAGSSIPTNQMSSVGGVVTVTRTAVGQYQFLMPHLGGTGAATFVVTAQEPTARLCVISRTATINSGATQLVQVSCWAAQSLFGADTVLSVSYARGINPLGKKSLSTAYVSVPRATSVVSEQLPAASGVDSIYGATGWIWLNRTATGHYYVSFQHQQWKVGAATTHAMAKRTSEGRCNVVNDQSSNLGDIESVEVRCEGYDGTPIDSAFILQYSGVQ